LEALLLFWQAEASLHIFSGRRKGKTDNNAASGTRFPKTAGKTKKCGSSKW
jgi:hypothetical protein